MSGHNHFAALHETSTKLAKYKQAVLVEGSPAFPAACWLWLYARLRKLRPLERSAETRIETGTNLPFARIAQRLHEELASDTAIAQALDLDFQEADAWPANADVQDGVAEAFARVLASRSAWPAAWLSLSSPAGPDTCAALCALDGGLFFFSPQAGEYRVDAPDAFAAAFAGGLATATGQALQARNLRHVRLATAPALAPSPWRAEVEQLLRPFPADAPANTG